MAGKLKNYDDWPWSHEESRELEEWAASSKHDVEVFAIAAQKALAKYPGLQRSMMDLLGAVDRRLGAPDTRPPRQEGMSVSFMDILNSGPGDSEES